MKEHPQETGHHRMSTGRVLLSTVVLLGIAVGGYLVLYGLPEAFSRPREPAAEASAAPQSIQAPAAPAVSVETGRARRGDLVMRITATGTAEATRQLQVQSAVAGTIIELPIGEGAVVSAADLLAALDDTELRLKVQIQRESLVAAMAKFAEKRAFMELAAADSPVARELAAAQQAVIGGVMSPQHFRSLIDDPRFDALFETITRDEVMAAQDGLLTRRANYAMAELELGRARTLAPFGGQIAELQVVVGQRVGAGTKLLTLVDAHPIRVRIAVLESEAGLVRVGRRAEVIFAAFPTETFVGQVEAINPLVDPETKILEVTLSLPNPELRLRPGMFAQITLDTEIFSDRLLVPHAAVQLRDDRPMLFVVRNDRAQWVYIRRGLENTDWVEVLEGVQPGDEVVTSGHYSLAHDAVVRVVATEEAEEGRRP